MPPILSQRLYELGIMADKKRLKMAYKTLSDQYRKGVFNPFPKGNTLEHNIAYLVCRLPATFGALCTVFKEILKRRGNPTITSLLDLGAGPGTSIWAGAPLFPNLKRVTCIERNSQMTELGQKLCNNHFNFLDIEWQNIDMERSFCPSLHDLVLFSYSLFEIPSWPELLQTAWRCTKSFLVLVEPGTPLAFARLLQARKSLLQAGAFLLAPCPHRYECPLKATDDWCHFSIRIERSLLHRELKEGQLPYEDEKFCYLIASKTAPPSSGPRILRSPIKSSGHTHLHLCNLDGKAGTVIVSRKEKFAYRMAKKARWGDSLDEKNANNAC